MNNIVNAVYKISVKAWKGLGKVVKDNAKELSNPFNLLSAVTSVVGTIATINSIKNAEKDRKALAQETAEDILILIAQAQEAEQENGMVN